MVQLVLLIALFITLSGIMAITEAAVLSVSRAEVEVLVDQKRRGAVALRRLKNRVTRAVVIIVVVTNTINVLGPVLVGTYAVELYGRTVIGVVTAILTLGTIVFSEIIPKSLGTHYAPQISSVVAGPLLWLSVALYPLVWVFERLTGALKRGERRIGTEEQIRSLVRLGHSAGYIETDETQLVHRAFQLNDRRAAQIMTPLNRAVCVSSTMSVRDAAQVVKESSYSRYPVVDQSSSVVGIIISHHLLQALTQERYEMLVTEIMQVPLVVDSEMRADDLLALFRNRRFHLAIVLRSDVPVGIVTLEDVLEELVGEIADEKGI